MSGVFIDVNANADRATRELKDVNKSLNNIETSALSAGKTVKRAVQGIAAIATVGFSGNALFKISNNFVNLENKIAVVTGRTNELIASQRALFKIANDTRSSIQGAVDTFGSFGRALKGSGKSMSQILVATKSLQQSIALSGAEVESANSAIIQLGQGLAAGELRGQELLSVMEQLPRLANAIADGLDVPVGKLKVLAEAGKLTSEQVFQAIIRQSATINKEFQQLAPTIGQAGTILKDSTSLYIFQLDKGLGLTARISEGIFKFGRGIRSAADGAFELGNRFTYSLQTVTQLIGKITGPLFASIKTLGGFFLRILPEASLTETFLGDFQKGIRDFDREFLGSLITNFRQFKLIDLLNIESDVELALRQIRRLSPQYWAAAGFNVESFREFFSVRNLKLYGEAFEDLSEAIAGNANSVGTILRKTFIELDFITKASLKYLGITRDTLVALEAGFLETFFLTIAEIGKGLTGLAVPITDTSRLLFDLWAPSLFNVFSFLRDVVNSVPRAFVATANAALKVATNFVAIIAQLVKDFIPRTSLSNIFAEAALDVFFFFKSFAISRQIDKGLDNINSFVSSAKSALKGFFTFNLGKSIYDATLDGLDSTLRYVSDFGERVKAVFFDIYDAVVGNSYWPDTIDEVVEYGSNLWSRASGGLLEFRNKTLTLFSEVYDSIKDLLNRVEIKLPSVGLPKKSAIESGLSKISSVLETFANKIRQVFIDTGVTIQDVIQGALNFIGSVLVLGLLQGSVIGQLRARVLGIVAAIVITMTNEFSKKAFGSTLPQIAGEAIGRFIGSAISEFIRAIPLILDTATAFFSSFIQGLSGQLPLLGGALQSLFDIAGKFSASAPGALGLIGTYLFGKGAFMALLGLGKEGGKAGIVKYIKDIAKTGGNILMGKDGGILSTHLFGPLGPARVLSGIGLVAAQFGALDTLFMDSILIEYATKGGLLYLMLTGEQGLGKIKQLFVQYLGRPMLSGIQAVLNKTNIGTKFADVIFGNVGTFGQRFGDVFGGAVAGVVTSVTSKVLPLVTSAGNWITTLFLGTDPKATLGAIRNVLSDMLVNFRNLPVWSAIATRFSSLFSPSAASASLGVVSGLFSRMGALFTSFATRVGALGGSTGLLGRLFLGRFGKAALLATIIGASLFASKAFAKEDGEQDASGALEDSKSAFESLKEDFKNFKVSNPMTGLLVEIVGVSIPAILVAMIAFRRRLAAILSTAFDASVFRKFADAAVASSFRVKRAYGNALGSIGGLLLGGAIGNEGGAIIGSIIGGVIGGGIVEGIAKIFTGSVALATVGKAILGGIAKVAAFVFSVPVLLGAAGLAGAGLLTVWLFGKEDSFTKNLENAYKNVRELFNLEPIKPEIDLKTGLSTEIAKVAKDIGVKAEFSVVGINKGNLGDGELEKLNSRLSEYSDVIKEAKKETEESKKISEGTNKRLSTLGRGLDNLTKNLARTSAYDPEDFRNALEGLSNQKDKLSIFERSNKATKQVGLDIAFGLSSVLAKFTAGGGDRLQELQGQKSTKYNAFYTPPEDLENVRELLKLSTEYAKSEKPNDILIKQINSAKAAYLDAFEEFRAEEDRGFFSKIELGPDSPFVQSLGKAADLLKERLQQGIREGARLVGTRELNNELNNTKADLKGFGVDVPDTTFLNNIDLEELKTQLNFLKLIENQLATNSPTLKEQNANLASQQEIIAKTNKIFEEALKNNPNLSSAVRASIRLEDIDLGISPETVKRLPEQIADQFNIVLDSMKNGKLDEMFMRLSPSKVALNEIRDRYRAYSTLLQSGNLEAIEEVATNFGVPFDKLVKDSGVTGLKNALGQVLQLNESLDIAKVTNNASAFEFFSGALGSYSKSLQEATLDVQGLIGVIGGAAASGFDVDSLVALDDSDLGGLRVAARDLKFINDEIAALGKNFKAADVQRLLGDKLRASARAAKITVRALAELPNAAVESLKSVGFTTFDAMSRLAQSGIDAFSGLRTEIEIAKIDLSLMAVGTEEFRKQIELLASLENKEKALRSATTDTLSDKNNVVGSILSAGFSDREFALLDGKVRTFLFGFASSAKNIFDNLAIGAKGALQGSLDLFKVISAADSQTGILKVAKELEVAFADGVFEGIGKGFERASGKIENLTLNQFARASKKARDQFRDDTESLDALASLAESGLTGSQQDLLLGFDGSNAREIVNSIASAANISVSQLLADVAPKSEIQTLSTTLAENNELLKKSTEAISKSAGLNPDDFKIDEVGASVTVDGFEAGGRDLSGVLKKIDKSRVDTNKALITSAFNVLEADKRALQGAAKAVGQSLDLSTLRLASAMQQTEIKNWVNALVLLDEKSKDLSPKEFQMAQMRLKAGIDNLISDINRLATGAIKAGQQLTENMRSSLQSGFSDLLSGENGSLNSFFTSLADSFTMSVIDAFSQGVADKLISGMMEALNTAGVAQYDLGNVVGEVMDGFFSPIISGFKSLGVGIQGMLASLASGESGSGFFSSLLKIGSSFLGGSGEGVADMQNFQAGRSIGLAAGGLVRGPGGPTEDRVPIMGSNGEFMVNAKATRENYEVLQAINSGKVKKGALSRPTFSSGSRMSGERGNQVINLNITGDISRQTKSEIYKMLPSIAQGVNHQNREKGIR